MVRFVKIALVQPKAYRFGEEKKNLPLAIKYVEAAAKKGAQIICFPECYPGPYSGPINFSPIEDMLRTAQNLGVYILFGAVTKEDNKIYDKTMVASPDGTMVGERAKIVSGPADKYLSGGKVFTSGSEIDVTDTKLGKIGILICREVWYPELARILALKGADIIFVPLGNIRYRETLKNILWSRAIENTVYVACTQNLFLNEQGFSYIMSPEEIIGENLVEGILVKELDLERLRLLKESEDEGLTEDAPTELWLNKKRSYRVIPGLLRYRKPLQIYKSYLE
jgi:predicted amidohydrolase